MRTAFRLLAAAFVAAAFATPALATIKREPVRIRAVGPAPVLHPGEAATIEFEVAVGKEAFLDDLSVESPSLAAPFERRGSAMRLAAASRQRFAVTVRPTARPEPLTIRYTIGGVPHEQKIDLAGRMQGSQRRPRRLVKLDTPGDPAFRASIRAAGDSARAERARSGQVGTSWSFGGRLLYTRPANGTSPPAQLGAARIRVRLMEKDWDFDDEVWSGYTDPAGRFSGTTSWSDPFESDHELYFEFETQNEFSSLEDGGFWSSPYTWATAPVDRLPGEDLDIGDWQPADADADPALHIMSNLFWFHRWYDVYAHYEPASVTVYWPQGTNASYDDWYESIDMSTARQWQESVLAHEYGHHFVNLYAADEDPSYCNGNCDNNGCGHCLWCEEGTNEAFSEGWPDWISSVQTHQTGFYPSAIQPLYHIELESIRNCAGSYHDATRTEGNFAAILWDLYDSGPGSDDLDPNGFGYRDGIGLGFDEIITVLDLDSPTNAPAFLVSFANRYMQYRAQLWQVAMNNRWNLDVSPPSPAGGLWSTSHPVSTPTANLNLALQWTPSPGDDVSGLRGYSITVAPSPTQPDAVIEAGPVTSWRSSDLAPGTWYATICAVDWSGNVSTAVTAGPFIVVQPTPVDIAPYLAPGWARPLVARATADATAGSVPNPAGLLPGNTAPTYLNVSGRNQGQSAHVGVLGIRTTLFVDGSMVHTSGYVHPDAPGATFTHLNRAASVRGGRHMVGEILDGMGEWWESNEVNNYWSHAWVWSPLSLTAGVQVHRPLPPPNPTGSWSGVVDGSPTYYNCDGFRLTPSGAWEAVWIAADADTDDYDLRYHAYMTSSPDQGFDTVYDWSARPAGELDALVINNRLSWLALPTDFGVINDPGLPPGSGPQSGFVVKHVTSTSFPFAETLAVALPDSEMFVLKEVSVPGPGAVNVTLWADSSAGPLRVAWLNRSFLYGTVADSQWTWPTGKVSFDVPSDGAGYCCVAISRDPEFGRGAVSCTLGVGPARCDLTPSVLAGGAGALVPSPAPVDPLAVSEPDTLHAAPADTYLGLAWRNSSLAAVPSAFGVRVEIDGQTAWSSSASPLAPLTGTTWSGVTIPPPPPVAVAGGRHVLALRCDGDGLVPEASETNNAWGGQWVWAPATLPLGTALAAPAPPDPAGGFESCTGAGSLYPNCAGYRVTFGTAPWSIVALMPDDTTDADLRLHEPRPGAQEGFAEALGLSAWGPGQSEYVLARHAGPRTLDAGVARGAGAAGGLTLTGADGEGVASLPLATANRVLAAGEIARVHPVVLPAGAHRVRLVHVSGSVDWGLSIHDDSTAVQGKSDAWFEDWDAPAGEGEELLVHVAVADTFVVVAWKRGSADLPVAGTYRLEIVPDATDAGAVAAAWRSRIVSAGPTPFRDRTRFAVDLAAAGELRLDVYDLRGARVRSLAQGTRAAGRHEFEWQGRDDDDRAVPPGLYWVRLQAGRDVGLAKVVKVR